MEFKYPKDFHGGSRLAKTVGRPQPSPSKTQQFMKDLGLDDDDTLADISSPSDDDSSDETQPSEIEFNILQKELYSCTQQRDLLKDKNQELEKNLLQLKARLKKEESSKRTRVKIIQRAYADGLRDKQNLIINLQELIEENGDPSGLKMVSTIEHLHEQKAELHDQLLKAQEEYEEKLNHVEYRLERGGLNNEANQRSSMVLEKIAEEKIKIALELEETKKIHAEEIRTYEELLKKKESELNKTKNEKEKKRRSDNSFKLKLNNLTSELESNKRSFHEKEIEYRDVIKKHKEDMKRMEKERETILKESESLEHDMLSRLTNQQALSNESSIKLQEENKRMIKELDRCQRRIASLEEDASRMERLQQDEMRLRNENDELEAKIRKLDASLEKHKTSAREKLQYAEHEAEETRLLMQQQRKEANASYDDLKETLKNRENELKLEIVDVIEAQEEQKKTSEKAIRKLEDKLSKSRDKTKKLEEELSDLKSQIHNKNKEVENLNGTVSSANSQLKTVSQKLQDTESKLKLELVKVEGMSNELNQAGIEKDNFKRQLAVLSGQSDTAIAEMEKESGALRIKLNSTQNMLQAETRKHESLQKMFAEAELKIVSLKNTHSDEMIKHQGSVESINEVHKREILKLKASTAITTQTLSTKATTLEKALRLCLTNLRQMSHNNATLRREVERFPGLLKDSIKQAAKQVADAVSEISETNKELVRRYKKEMKLRKKYHNELVELKGNIRVFVRTRPTISEDGANAKVAVSYDDNDDSMIYVNNPQKGRTQTFELDRVFAGNSTQEEVYAEVQSLVTSCMDGYHVCIFAYGQTGSGKTYTMEGTKSKPGINQRALNDLFLLIEDRSQEWDYNITVSLVEIYNETLKDLLNNKQEKLEIKMNADGTLFVQRLNSVTVKDLDDVNKLFKTGHSNRATASTNMNERSSRSHAVLVINVAGKNKTTGHETLGKLNLIDLAGSERVSKSGASGDRLKEAQNINRSLSALGDVIHALRNKQAHVPFRNSKLTYLLQDSLSKDSKTLMLVQVSPIERSIGETVCSLTFAQRVRLVELGQASKKVKS